jgi:hypothetical protein
VRNSLVQLTPWLLSKHLELAFDDSAQALHVMASTAAIDIALNNLITNAANFSPEHGVITVKLSRPMVSAAERRRSGTGHRRSRSGTVVRTLLQSWQRQGCRPGADHRQHHRVAPGRTDYVGQPG